MYLTTLALGTLPLYCDVQLLKPRNRDVARPLKPVVKVYEIGEKVHDISLYVRSYVIFV